MSRNQDVKEKAAESRVFLWEIAKEMGIADSTFSRKLRREFSRDEKENIFAIIEKVRKEHEKNNLYLR